MTAEVTWDDHEPPATPYPGWMRHDEGHAYERQVAEQFKTAMSALTATVCVVAASRPSGERTGTTATAVCSLSTEPPQIVACVNRESSRLPRSGQPAPGQPPRAHRAGTRRARAR